VIDAGAKFEVPFARIELARLLASPHIDSSCSLLLAVNRLGMTSASQSLTVEQAAEAFDMPRMGTYPLPVRPVRSAGAYKQYQILMGQRTGGVLRLVQVGDGAAKS
jgi:hypothetical protein